MEPVKPPRRPWVNIDWIGDEGYGPYSGRVYTIRVVRGGRKDTWFYVSFLGKPHKVDDPVWLWEIHDARSVRHVSRARAKRMAEQYENDVIDGLRIERYTSKENQ